MRPMPSPSFKKLSHAFTSKSPCSLVISPSSLLLHSKALYLRSTVKFHTDLHLLSLLPDSPICRNAGDACPALSDCGLSGICVYWILFLVHKIPICLHTVLIVCRRFFLAQQFHIANLLLEHIHEIGPIVQSHHSRFRR